MKNHKYTRKWYKPKDSMRAWREQEQKVRNYEGLIKSKYSYYH